MDEKVKIGFDPIFSEDSQVLILGSFPSVKSREIAFYYGHKQNRFWHMICGFFNEEIPSTIADKKDFLLRRRIALWDIATSCKIDGSADSSLREAEIADLTPIFQSCQLKKILLNGSLSYELFTSAYANVNIPYRKMPSTSPANPRYAQDVWWRELNDVFHVFR